MNHMVNEHERAQTLLMQQRVEGVSNEDSLWLESHLAGCEDCVQQAFALAEAMQQARSEALQITASAALVRSTQSRVRARARQLEWQRERMLPVWMAAAMALGWTVVSTPLLWEGFSWLGNLTHAPAILWQSGFIFSWLTPTALIGAAALSRRDRIESST
jgi:hypothetical protein